MARGWDSGFRVAISASTLPPRATSSRAERMKDPSADRIPGKSPETAALPALSVVLVVYDMPDQAARTLESLSPAQQRGAPSDAYEVVVVENASARPLGEARARAAAPNARYFLRADPSQSPVEALSFGVAQARGRRLALCVDGARLVTPGVVSLALLAERLGETSVLSVPGYHLGRELQQEAVQSGYDEEEERGLLLGIGWPGDGYRLFDIACFSGSCRGGFFVPLAESNFLSFDRSVLDRIGGIHPGFVSRGGGFVNLDLYAEVCALPDTRLLVTPGEGTFHQFHGGVTTGGIRHLAREQLMEGFVAEYRSIRGRDYQVPTREALLFGAVPGPARRFVRASLESWEARSPAAP